MQSFMPWLQILVMENMSFNVISKNKFLANISEFIITLTGLTVSPLIVLSANALKTFNSCILAANTRVLTWFCKAGVTSFCKT